MLDPIAKIFFKMTAFEDKKMRSYMTKSYQELF